MQLEQTKKGTLFYYREEENHRNIASQLKDLPKQSIEVTAPAMQKISPFLILDHGANNVHPLISITANKDIFKEEIPVEKDLRQEFEKNEIIQENEKVKGEVIELAKPDDNNSERRNFDRYNLMRGFVLSHDPLGNFDFTSNEDFDEVELNYENLNDKLNNIFGIKIN